MSILTANYFAGCFDYVATYPCDTFGPPKPAPGDIYIYTYIYIERERERKKISGRFAAIRG